jgi:hypothetical protein
MEKVQKAIKMQREAQRRRLLAPANDPIRRAFDLELANGLDEDAQALDGVGKPCYTGAVRSVS